MTGNRQGIRETKTNKTRSLSAKNSLSGKRHVNNDDTGRSACGQGRCRPTRQSGDTREGFPEEVMPERILEG